MMITEKQLRIIKTFNMYLSSTASGMCTAVTGPTLIDLQNIVHTDTRHIAFIYTARSSGYLLGSLIGGILFDMTPRKQFGMTIFNCLIAVSMFALPWSRSIEILTLWMVLNGIALGALDTGLNVWCFNLWGKDSGPFYQALHFTYGFGSLIAPLIAAPFLGNYSSETTTNRNASIMNQHDGYNFNQTTQNSSLHSTQLVIPPIFYGYAVIGSLALLVTLLFFVTCILAPLDDNGQQNKTKEVRKISRSFAITVVLLNFLLLFFCTGNEIGYAQMLTTYAVKGPLRLSATVGSYLTSAFWAAFTFSRFSSIFLAIKFSNLALIVFNISVTMAGAAILLLLAGKVEWALWLASVFLGVGIAPLFPTAVAWIEQYITVTNKIVALFAIGAAFGEMVIPYTISHFLEEVPQVLSYVVTASCVLSVVLTFMLYLVLRNKKDKYFSEKGATNTVCETNAPA